MIYNRRRSKNFIPLALYLITFCCSVQLSAEDTMHHGAHNVIQPHCLKDVPPRSDSTQSPTTPVFQVESKVKSQHHLLYLVLCWSEVYNIHTSARTEAKRPTINQKVQ